MARRTEVIHGQLVNTGAATLLVPNTAVAEIIHYAEPERVGDAPSWMLGTLEWRGLRIPVVSFERAAGGDGEDPGAGHRIAILNGVNSGDQLRFFAIVIRGNPRLVNITHDDISKLAEREPDKLQLQAVNVKDTSAIIPDLAGLEQLVCQAGYRSERVH
jgi:chemosensory pili system protein ChpC